MWNDLLYAFITLIVYLHMDDYNLSQVKSFYSTYFFKVKSVEAWVEFTAQQMNVSNYRL